MNNNFLAAVPVFHSIFYPAKKQDKRMPFQPGLWLRKNNNSSVKLLIKLFKTKEKRRSIKQILPKFK